MSDTASGACGLAGAGQLNDRRRHARGVWEPAAGLFMSARWR